MKKYLILTLTFYSLFADRNDNPPPNVYRLIQGTNLGSLEWPEEDWPNESFRDYLKRCLDYQVNMLPGKKRRLVFAMYDRQASFQKEFPHSALFDLTTAQDLALFCGQKRKDPYLADIVCRTKTEFGRVYLYGLLASPSPDRQVLEERKALIKNFVDQPALYERMIENFTQIAETENMILAFWAQDGFFQTSSSNYFSYPYFTSMNTYLNSSEVALGARSILKHYTRAFFTASSCFAALLLPYAGFMQARKQKLPGRLNDLVNRLQGSQGIVLGMLTSLRSDIVAAGASLAAGVFCGLHCKEEYDWMNDNFFLDICLQQKMHSIARFFQALSNLKKTITSFSLDFPAAKKITHFFEEMVKNDLEMSQLVDIMRTETFAGSPSIFAHQGRVLVAFRLFYKVKEKMEPLLAALGEIDAYLSVATLYNEYKERRVHYCFACYDSQPGPKLTMKQFWNPFVDPSYVVANDLDLSPEQRNMVITGPNAGGKSTLIKAVAINLVLSQSLCIAAADSCMITPFHWIGTYLNVIDNIASGNSLFEAQVLRAQQMVELVEKTPLGHYSFLALDEMFNGTSSRESKTIAYSVGKHIGSFTRSICILATHFPLLTHLANELSSFSNYRVSVDIDPVSGIRYPFKLERGFSNQHIALDILRQEGYACSIVDQALLLMKHKAHRA